MDNSTNKPDGKVALEYPTSDTQEIHFHCDTWGCEFDLATPDIIVSKDDDFIKCVKKAISLIKRHKSDKHNPYFTIKAK